MQTLLTEDEIDILDHRALLAIRRYLNLVANDNDPLYLLSDEDGIAASMQADAIYMNETDWPAAQCSDRSMDLAFREVDRMRREAREQFSSTA